MELYLPSSFLAHAFACSIPFLVDLRIASAESIMYGAGGSGRIAMRSQISLNYLSTVTEAGMFTHRTRTLNGLTFTYSVDIG